MFRYLYSRGFGGSQRDFSRTGAEFSTALFLPSLQKYREAPTSGLA